jgi:hypothetical protein
MVVVPYQFDDTLVDDVFHQVGEFFSGGTQLRPFLTFLHHQLALYVLFAFEVALLAAPSSPLQVFTVALVLVGELSCSGCSGLCHHGHFGVYDQ